MPDIVIHVLVSAVYFGLAWHFWNTRWRHAAAQAGPGAALQPWERSAILVPLALHAALLYDGILGGEELRFGFAHALSAMLWLAAAIYWIENLYVRLEGLQPVVLAAAGLCAMLPAWFPGRLILHGASMEFRAHLALAIVAHSVFMIAILHAALMMFADRVLHRKGRSFVPVASLPPLLSIEQMLFRLIWVAFVLLTLTLASGMALSDSLFGRAMRFNHGTVFALLAWITVGVLLLGRHFYGWRGRTAVRWTVAGFVMVVLANIGTAFVLEVLLRRS